MDQTLAPIAPTLTFRVGGERFALSTDLVSEVARMPPLSRVPHAPASLLGLANVRGRVIPVLSMANLLGREAAAPSRIIIVDVGERLGLAVDDARQIAEAERTGALPEIDIAELVGRGSAPAVKRFSGTSAAPPAERERETDTVALLAFAIGNQEFAVPLAAIDEVLRLPDDIAALPDADDAVIGSAAVRGAVLPLLSLRALLAFPAAAVSPRSRVLVVHIGSHRVGLLVDEMRSILRVREAMIDGVPQVLTRGRGEAKIQAICRLDDGARLVSVLAVDQLLRDDLTERLLRGGPMEQQDMAQEAEAPAEQFLLFQVGADEFAIPIASVVEVAQLPAKLAPLPKAPAFVKGVMNLRGQVVPVIDQAQRFGAAAPNPGRRRVIVVRIDDLTAGFIVDAVSEVLRVEAGALQPAPDLGNAQTRVFERVANLADEQRIVLIVSPRELLDRAEQDLLHGLGSASKAKRRVKTP